MKNRKKVISFILTLMLLLGLMPMGFAGGVDEVYADGVDPTYATTFTSVGGIYQIQNATELTSLAAFVNGGASMSGVSFEIPAGTTIDLTGVAIWTPIGNGTYNFSGNFDGNNSTISNLKFSSASAVDGIGLFGYTSGAEIRDLNLANVSISAVHSDFAGGLIGYSSNTSISGVSVSGSLQGLSVVGGLIGSSISGGKITDCNTNVGVTGLGNNIGGLIGYNTNANISKCYAIGDITSDASSANVGGLVGSNAASGVIENSYAAGDVSGNSAIGGLVGDNAGTISYTYSIGDVNGTTTVGGLVGLSSGGIINNSFWDTSTSGITTGALGTPKNTTEMTTNSSLFTEAGWNFAADGTWRMGIASYKYPVFIPPLVEYSQVSFDSNDSGQLNLQGTPSPAAISNGAIVLTKATGGAVGSAFFNQKIKQKDGFSSYFKFYLNDQSGGGTGGADGIIFVMASTANKYGSVGGGMGYGDITSSVGIEFDTFDNSATAIEPSNSHIAVNVNGQNIITTSPVAVVDLGDTYFHSGTNIPYYAWVDYDGATLSVFISKTATKPSTANLTANIKVEEYAGDEYYIGFTAATGGSYQEQKISEWKFVNKNRPWASADGAEATTVTHHHSDPIVVVPEPVHNLLRFNIGHIDSFLILGSSDEILKPMDVAPIIRGDRTLLPIRFVVEPLGGTIIWNEPEQKVTITRVDTTIELWINKNIAKVNGVDKLIDPDNALVKPIIVKPGRTMLPVRFISEALGCTVDWNPVNEEVTVSGW